MTADTEAREIAARLTDKMRDALLGDEHPDERTTTLCIIRRDMSRVLLMQDGMVTADGLRVRAALVEMEGRG